MVRIAIVGAGALGVRHLQSLARIEGALHVDVVDPSSDARSRSVQALDAAGGLKSGSVELHESCEEICVAPDMAIVATNSKERIGAIESVVRAGARRLILEKVLFSRPSDYERCEALLADKAIPAWVNCVRRTYPKAVLIEQFVRGKRFSYKVEGTGWGLGCNVIHHLDEFASLAGSDEVSLSEENLDRETIPSKRSGYIEFTGTLAGEAANGRRFSAHCRPGEFTGRDVTIEAEDLTLKISQTEQTLTISDKDSMRTEPFPIPLQSEVTARHVTDILEGREPALPDYATAARLHRSMLTAFLAHLRRVSGNPAIDECPIT